MAAPGSTPFGDQRVPVDERHIELQAELARLSSQGDQRLIPESGHLVHPLSPPSAQPGDGSIARLRRRLS
jgi:hypothetical protein